MTPPLISSKKITKNHKDEEANNDEQRQNWNHLIHELNQLKHLNYSLTLYNVIALCYVLILLLTVSWYLISSGYHVSISRIFYMKQADDITRAIRDYTNSILNNVQCYNVPRELRFDCHPENGASESRCQDRGCCWDVIQNYEMSLDETKAPLNIPYCFYSSDWKLYEYENFTQKNNDFSGFMKNNMLTSFYKNDLPFIKMESISIDESILRVKIYDPTNVRFEPMYPIRHDPKPFSKNITNAKYQFDMDRSKPGFRIKRKSRNATVIFDSLNAGGFIFADQFLQISTLLPSSNIYGLGEHRTNLKLNTDWQLLTLFNQDQAPIENTNLYGSHPFYLVIEDTGKCHGVLFLNSNAMDIILQPTPALTYRSIGGIFDFYFFMGPTPADVLRQYSEIVSKPFFPPYWALGFHLCRFGYVTLNKTIEVWNRTRNAGIPFDVQWNDLDYMDDSNDFTYNKNTFKRLPEFIDNLHQLGMHYIPLIDPGISAAEINGTYPPYDEGMRQNIFIKDNDTNLPFVGKVWNRVSTVWPDFTHPKAHDYWYTMMDTMHKYFKYDGAWLDMNEISNFYNGYHNGCIPNSLDYPPYAPNVPNNLLATKTLCMNAKHYLGHHYNIHNIYGTFESVTTYSALAKIRNKRPFILSRASWIGQGTYAAHWTGDVYSRWHDLRTSIPEILAFSLFQIPMVGADICGFNDNTTESLCNRWMQLGAFYPFSRNHNSDDTIEQDPVAMGDLVVKSSVKALTLRYRFLPYLYTLFYRASKFGDTVARPMFIEFIEDPETWDIDTQFLWGSAFLIVPVLEENKVEVIAYLPRGIWYNYYTKEQMISKGEKFTLNAPLDTIPILIRGGFILPAQTPGKTTTESRKNPFELLVALDDSGCAIGELYWDDGDSIVSVETHWFEFTLKNQVLNIENTGSPMKHLNFNSIGIMGVMKDVKWVTVNGHNVHFDYNEKTFYLVVNNLPSNLKGKVILMWG